MFGTYKQVLSLIAIILCLSSIVFAYSGGSGEANNPYQISNVNDLLELGATSSDYNKCFILTADIDLDPNLPGGQVFTQAIIAADTAASNYSFDGTAFTGTFDGNNHEITHFVINGGSNWYIGLFGYISGGSVKNLGLESFFSGSEYVGGRIGYNDNGFSYYSSCYVGGLAGHMENGSIENCYSTGIIDSVNLVGGIVGFAKGSNISNCNSMGTINGYECVGGLVGSEYDCNISNCNSTRTISGYYTVGGLVGGNSGNISNCNSMGTIDGHESVGGIVGYNSGSISNCYSTGTVSGFIGFLGSSYIGGLVGYHNGGNINNCYSTGIVENGQCVGGLVGYTEGGNIINCYSTGTVSNYYEEGAGGLVGYNGGSVVSGFWDVNTSGQTTSAGGEGKTTEEMQTLSIYTSAGWDFSYDDGDEADWFIQIDEYPILTWQISPADIYTDSRNNFRDFAIFAQYWMREDCRVYNDYCEWSDLNFDGFVDFDDLIELMSYWLENGIYE